ncbi:uncharacterized protein tnfrsf13b isoform 2-T2 [Polymixia lowei]
MTEDCPAGRYWDLLVKACLPCNRTCKDPHISVTCRDFCVYANCKEVPGHYYDRLLKRCMVCSELCGSHPAECSHVCMGQPTPSTLPAQNPAVETPAILMLAMCAMLMLSTLSLALVVIWRRPRARPTKPGPAVDNRPQADVSQVAQEVNHPRQSSRDCVVDPGAFQPTDPQPASESSPTETCECAHCFPDIRVPSWGEERSQRPPFSICQESVHNGKPLLSQEGPTHPQAGSPGRKGGGSRGLRIICSPSQPSI